MIKRIGIVAAGVVILAGLVSPAHADTAAGCDPATRPAPVQRVEQHFDTGKLSVKVTITHANIVCYPFLGGWVLLDPHVQQWKRYNHEAPNRACRMYARHQVGTSWTAWTHAPWGDATNC